MDSTTATSPKHTSSAPPASFIVEQQSAASVVSGYPLALLADVCIESTAGSICTDSHSGCDRTTTPPPQPDNATTTQPNSPHARRRHLPLSIASMLDPTPGSTAMRIPLPPLSDPDPRGELNAGLLSTTTSSQEEDLPPPRLAAPSTASTEQRAPDRNEPQITASAGYEIEDPRIVIGNKRPREGEAVESNATFQGRSEPQNAPDPPPSARHGIVEKTPVPVTNPAPAVAVKKRRPPQKKRKVAVATTSTTTADPLAEAITDLEEAKRKNSKLADEIEGLQNYVAVLIKQAFMHASTIEKQAAHIKFLQRLVSEAVANHSASLPCTPESLRATPTFENAKHRRAAPARQSSDSITHTHAESLGSYGEEKSLFVRSSSALDPLRGRSILSDPGNAAVEGAGGERLSPLVHGPSAGLLLDLIDDDDYDDVAGSAGADTSEGRASRLEWESGKRASERESSPFGEMELLDDEEEEEGDEPGEAGDEEGEEEEDSPVDLRRDALLLSSEGESWLFSDR